MEDTKIALLIGLMAGSIFFIDGWGPTEKAKPDKDGNTGSDGSIFNSRRFRGLSVLIAGGIITPVLDYVTKNTRPEFFMAYLKGCIYGWFFVLLFGLLLYLFWIITKQQKKETVLFKLGEFAYSILDFIYLGISDNPHLTAKRNSDVALAQNIYKLESDYEYKKLEKQLSNIDVKPNEITESTKKIIQQYEEQLKSIKTEADYTFNDWYYKGITEYDKQEYEKVIAYMKNAVEKDRNSINAPDAFIYMGLGYERINLSEKGIEQYDIIIKNYPGYANMYQAHYNKGVILQRLKRHKEALDANEEAIKLNPQYSFAWNNKGVILKSMGQFDDALKAYEEAIRINPDYINAWFNKGDILIELKNNSEAIKAFEEVLKLDPNDAEARYYCATLYAETGDKKNMLSQLKKLIKLDVKYKDLSKTDDFFKAFWEDPDFKKLVE